MIRLETNLTLNLSLHWDYDHDGPEPPGMKLNPSPIPDSFPGGSNSIARYHEIFEPLVLLETWSSLCSSKDDKLVVVDVEIASRRHIDTWVDIDIIIGPSIPPKWWLSEADIVLLRPSEGTGSVLAKVMTSKKSSEGVHASIRCSFQTDRLRVLNPTLSVRSHWQLSRVYRCVGNRLMQYPFSNICVV